ncbi:phage head-tail adaptor, putative, SPP1 family [Pseudovibrio denitrificans]|uniref:Phage head-tail adaptor, putative, SPP1 family n=1 Tax=Pseudovibrio denitrificans TaxID=258256 RepID=A0A1I6YDL3_9HYPH|nr:phage head closure protein [Pseudovibrio denitrificans]SFT48478.1 phage head-tail adaptor, putative, SPP1 family [Pseudovibrio denitrificans]
MRAAGTLNEPMLLLRPETTNGTDGSVTRSYQQVAMVWGQVEASTGSEATTAGRISSSYPLTITLRRRTDVAEGWRLEQDGQSLRVKAILPNSEQDAFMQILCEQEEGDDGGT